MKIEEFIDDSPASLEPYGLAKPSAELILRDKENSVHLLFGDRKDDLIYFKRPDEQGVYAMKDTILDFLNVKPFTVVDKFAFIVNIDNVNKLRIQAPGKSFSSGKTAAGRSTSICSAVTFLRSRSGIDHC